MTGGRSWRARSAWLAAAAVPTGFLGVLFAWPLMEVLRRSLAGVGPDRVLEILGRASVRSVAGFTIGQALLSTVLTLVLGLPIAHAVARYRFPGRGALRALVVVPFVLPTLVVAAAVDAVLDAIGLEAGGGPIDRSLLAILYAHVFFNLAVVVRIVGGHWSTLDRRPEEAARVLGAGPWQAFRRITVPRLVPVLAGAASVVFLFTVTSFGIVLVLGAPRRATIETEIYRYAVFRQEFDVAAVLALAQLAVVGVLAVLAARLQRRATTERRRADERSQPVDTARRRLHLSGVLAVVAVTVGLPVGALVERSLRVGDGYGIDHYRALAEPVSLLPTTALDAVATSLRIASVSAVVATAVGVVAALVVVRGGRVGRTLEATTLVPLGVSAVTLGFGYLLAFRFGDLRRSPWIVPMAHAVIGLPFVLAAVVPALRSIDGRLREVAATLGAPPLAVWRAVDLPVLRRAAVIGAGFSVAISVGEFGATSFLGRGEGTFTAPLAIFRLLSQPGAAVRGQALALSVVVGLVVAVVAGLLEQRRGRTVSAL